MKHFEREFAFFSSSYFVHINTLTANILKYINKLKKKGYLLKNIKWATNMRLFQKKPAEKN